MARIRDGAKLTAGVIRRSIDSFFGLSASAAGAAGVWATSPGDRATASAAARPRRAGPTSSTTAWSILFLGVGWPAHLTLSAAAPHARRRWVGAVARAERVAAASASGATSYNPWRVPDLRRPPVGRRRSRRRTSPPTCSSRSSPKAPGPMPASIPRPAARWPRCSAAPSCAARRSRRPGCRSWRAARQASRVLIVGSGKPEDLTPERWRRLGIVAGLAVRQRRFGRLACLVPDAEARPEVLQALVEGVLYAALDLDTYKTGDRDTTPLTEVLIRVETPAPDLVAAVARGRILGEATNFARLMANEPGNVLTPRVFVERGAALAAGTSLDVQIHDEKAIAGARHGPDRRRRPRLRRAGAAADAVAHAARRHQRAGARAGRQGRHLRHRRHLDQAGRHDGPDEGRHGRRRRGDHRDARAQPARGADPRRRRRPGGREHAGRQGAEARRRDPRRQRQDRRSAQHRRRGPPDPRRRAVVRAREDGRDAPRRRRDADRRLRRRARPHHQRRSSARRSGGSTSSARRARGPAIGCGRCRSTRNTRIS